MILILKPFHFRQFKSWNVTRAAPRNRDQYSHVHGARLTCGTNALIPADLEHRVGEPYCCLTGRVAHTRQVLTAEGDTGQLLSSGLHPVFFAFQGYF